LIFITIKKKITINNIILEGYYYNYFKLVEQVFFHELIFA